MTINIPEGMVAWNGGDRPPADWDGGPVLLRDGTLLQEPWADLFRVGIGGCGIPNDGDAVAYTPKPDHIGYAEILPDDIGGGEAFASWLKSYVGKQDASKMRFSVDELAIAFAAGSSPTPYPAIGREEIAQCIRGLSSSGDDRVSFVPTEMLADAILALIQTKGEGKG